MDFKLLDIGRAESSTGVERYGREYAGSPVQVLSDMKMTFYTSHPVGMLPSKGLTVVRS